MSTKPTPFEGDDSPETDGGSDAVPGAVHPTRPTTRIDVPWRVFARAILASLLIVGFIHFFEAVATVVVLVALSLLLTAVLNPLTARLERRGVPTGLAAMVSVAVAVLVLVVLLALVLPPLIVQGISIANDLPNQLQRLHQWLARYPEVYAALEHRAEVIRQDPAAFFSGFLRFGVGAVSTIVSGVLILTLTLYFLTGRERVRSALLRHFSPAYRGRVDRTITEAARVIRAYFTGQAIVSTMFGTMVFVVLTILGVPYASVVAALAFFLDAVPNIGSALAVILSTLVALGSEGLRDALIVLVTLIVYQQIENNVVSPRILAGKLDIPPVLTLTAILVGGAVLGVIGVILAIPTAGMLPIIDRIWITGEPEAPPAADDSARPAAD